MYISSRFLGHTTSFDLSNGVEFWPLEYEYNLNVAKWVQKILVVTLKSQNAMSFLISNLDYYIHYTSNRHEIMQI